MFTARYGLIPYLKQIAFRLYKVNQGGHSISKNNRIINNNNKGIKINCWESLYMQIYRQRNRLITEQLTNDINALYEQAYLPHDLQHTP